MKFVGSALFGAAMYYLITFQPTVAPSEVKSPPIFQVVDTYQGCDIVEYSKGGTARYSYFLDCRKVR